MIAFLKKQDKYESQVIDLTGSSKYSWFNNIVKNRQ